jgi:hypothetical protein
MKVRSHLFSLSNNLDSLFAGLIGFILIQVFTKHSGIGVSPDSVTYISAARNMVQGHGFISYEMLPVTDFPFAYPFFLTIISFFTRLDALQFGSVLNGFLFALLLYICGSIMNGFEKYSGWYKRILLCCFLFSPALQEVYSFLWSETIFLLLILLFTVSMATYLRKKEILWLLVSAVVCALACLTRYAGVFLVLTGSVLIFFNSTANWRMRIVHCFIFGSISVSLLAINIIRNFSLTGLAAGTRYRNDSGLLKIMEYFGGVVSDWIPVGQGRAFSILVTLGVLMVFALTIYFTRRKKGYYGFEYVVAATGLMYCLFMLATSTLTRYEQFTARLLSPMFIPLLWSLTCGIPGYLSGKSWRLQWIVSIPALLITAWFINRELAADYEFYDGVKDAGIWGYQEDPFVQSGIVEYIHKNIPATRAANGVYSNAADAYYFVTGLPARQLPFKAFPEKVQQYYDSKMNWLVWFNDLDNPEMPDLQTILQHKNLILLKQLPDGAVYVPK